MDWHCWCSTNCVRANKVPLYVYVVQLLLTPSGSFSAPVILVIYLAVGWSTGLVILKIDLTARNMRSVEVSWVQASWWNMLKNHILDNCFAQILVYL
jgi:hypothetical protein